VQGNLHWQAGPSAAKFNELCPKKDIGQGILMQLIGDGQNVNAVHWNMPHGSTVARHEHPQEQFGYIVAGALEVIIGTTKFICRAGDSYIIPPNQEHEFTAIGDTEAIDIFSPKRDLSTAGGQQSYGSGGE
jgi:quercetin dioxygenase-like cupin family protein